MSGLKRVAVVLVCAVALFAFGGSFVPGEVQKRAIVIGLGLDFDKDTDGGVFVMTAEIVSPGNSGEQVGVFSKVITATGHSVGEAIFRISERTGKEPSLGQCGVLVLGRSLFGTRNFSDVVDYFAYSDSFKETAVICCAENADELFKCEDVLNKSVSLALVATLREAYKDVALPSDTLLEYARSQRELTKTGFLNFVKFVATDNSDPQAPDKENGYFIYDRIAVFRSNEFVAEVGGNEMRGFALLNENVSGDTMSFTHDGKTYALRVNSKKVGKSYVDGGIRLEVKLQVKLARADSADVGGSFAEKSDEQIPEEMLVALKNFVTQYIEVFLAKQVDDNFDITDFHELLRQKQGTSQELCAMPMSAFPVALTVSVKEN